MQRASSSISTEVVMSISYTHVYLLYDIMLYDIMLYDIMLYIRHIG